MLIGFLGSPISGKTTTAARLFAELKDGGYSSEFIPEQARVLIAQRRYDASKKNEEMKTLDDWDQFTIMIRQNNMEEIFSFASSRSLVITDCTAFLAMLYMTPEFRNEKKVLDMAVNSAKRFDILFRCHPVNPGELYDPNRVHSFEQSQILDSQLDDVIKFIGIPVEKIIELVGPSNVRSSRAHYEVMEKLICRR